MLTGHGGNIYELAKELDCNALDILDMSSNVNPLGPMPALLEHLKKNLIAIAALPQVDASDIIHAFSRRYETDPALVLAANGTTQFIFTLPLALDIQSALIVGPTYSDYGDACDMHGVDYHVVVSEEADLFQPDPDLIREKAGDADMVFICNPNNPTGQLIPSDDLKALIRSLPRTLFVIDESYLPFAQDGDTRSLINCNLPNAVILNSMSKIFRIPGLRIGFLKASPDIIARIRRFTFPWSVSSMAQQAVHFLMTERALVDRFVAKTRTYIQTERDAFAGQFEDQKELKCYPSSASFVLVRLPETLDARTVCRRLAEEGILIRNCDNFKGLSSRFVRISLKKETHNLLIAAKLTELCKASKKKNQSIPDRQKGEGNGY